MNNSKIDFFGKTCKTESQLEKAFKARCKARGVLAYKFSSPYRRGVPDALFINKQGAVVFVEFKNPNDGTQLSKLQQIEIRKMLEQGANVFVAYDANHAETIFSLMEKVPNA